VHNKLGPLPGSGNEATQDRMVDKLILPARTQTIVRLPESEDSRVKEGLVERAEILIQATSPNHTFRTADLDLAHPSPSYTNDLYSYTIPACTVEAPDDG
jgi:hypothetical protein